MSGPREVRFAQPLKTLKSEDGAITVDAFLAIRRLGDKKFIKLFPDFTALILAAMRSKKLKGAADTLLFFLHELMDVRVNGREDQIAIIAPAEKIAQATGKSIRAVREHIAILLELGFIKQPRPGIPDYVVPPAYAYRGVLVKLLKDQAQEGAVSATRASREMKARRPKKD